jgi:hypothetical protein
VVVTTEAITVVDITGAHALGELLDELDRRGIVLGLAELKGPVASGFNDSACSSASAWGLLLLHRRRIRPRLRRQDRSRLDR